MSILFIGHRNRKMCDNLTVCIMYSIIINNNKNKIFIRKQFRQLKNELMQQGI